MSKRRHPAEVAGMAPVIRLDGTLQSLSERKGTGQPRWSQYAKDAGLNIKFDLGDVLAHILHYVDMYSVQGRRHEGPPEMYLRPADISRNMIKDRRERGASIRGFSPSTIQRSINLLVEVGLLMIVGKGRLRNRLFRAAWDERLTENPKAVWNGAAKHLRPQLIRCDADCSLDDPCSLGVQSS